MIYIDDSIMKKGENATAGSKILKNFISPFDAAVVTRLGEEARHKSLCEFGLGNPGSLNFICDDGDALLCNDIFGFVRRQAVRDKLFYIRPTYGTVSRYGLIPTASSMDQIGIVCKSPQKGFLVLSKISGHDENDGAMFLEKNYSFSAKTEKITVRAFDEKLPALNVSEQVLHILAYAEICANISRYDGIKFGPCEIDYRSLDGFYKKIRSEFAYETKLAAIMGSALLSGINYTKYYEKAMKIRRLIKDALVFDSDQVLKVNEEGCHFAVLSGLPSLAFSHNGSYTELIAKAKNESALLSAWEALEK